MKTETALIDSPTTVLPVAPRVLSQRSTSKATLAFLSVAAFAVASFAAASPALAEKKDITITAHNFAFSPAVVTLEKGETYTLHLKSADNPHGLAVPEIGLHNVVITKAAQTIKITPTTAGTFVAHCSVFCGAGHAHMAMKFVVKSESAAGAMKEKKSAAHAKPMHATPAKPAGDEKKAKNPCAPPS